MNETRHLEETIEALQSSLTKANLLNQRLREALEEILQLDPLYSYSFQEVALKALLSTSEAVEEEKEKDL
jgi:hypothetical protein